MMNLLDLLFKKKTYLSGNWKPNINLIDALYKWNYQNKNMLSFTDMHRCAFDKDNNMSNDDMKMMCDKIDHSKNFIFMVGDKDYRSDQLFADKNRVRMECQAAVDSYMKGKLKKIVVIYNGDDTVDKSKCPEILRNIGTHIPSDIDKGGYHQWNYDDIKKAIL